MRIKISQLECLWQTSRAHLKLPIPSSISSSADAKAEASKIYQDIRMPGSHRVLCLWWLHLRARLWL